MSNTNTDAGAVNALAADRESAADDLDVMIKELGVVLRRYQHVTQQLSDLVGAHVPRRMEIPLVLALRAAGLGPFLARQLSGEPVSLRSICETDHARLVSR